MPAYANRRPSSLESSRRNGDPLAGRGTRLALRACALLVGRVHRSIPEMHDLRLSSGYDGITLGTLGASPVRLGDNPRFLMVPRCNSRSPLPGGAGTVRSRRREIGRAPRHGHGRGREVRPILSLNLVIGVSS